MAFVLALLLLVMIAVGSFRYLLNADARRRFNKDFAANPGQSLATYSCAVLFVAFVLCVFVHPIGGLQFHFGHSSITLWQLCGIALIVATAAMFAYGINPDRPKRK